VEERIRSLRTQKAAHALVSDETRRMAMRDTLVPSDRAYLLDAVYWHIFNQDDEGKRRREFMGSDIEAEEDAQAWADALDLMPEEGVPVLLTRARVLAEADLDEIGVRLAPTSEEFHRFIYDYVTTFRRAIADVKLRAAADGRSRDARVIRTPVQPQRKGLAGAPAASGGNPEDAEVITLMDIFTRWRDEVPRIQRTVHGFQRAVE
jgi:hypothetical protein